MQNIFYDRKISQIFDLKGSLRGRFASQKQNRKDEHLAEAVYDGPSANRKANGSDADQQPDRMSSNLRKGAESNVALAAGATLLDGGGY
jgi:Phosphatidylinositol-4-phosphate 5-Kinase